jgi:hypothetical protein
VEKLAGDGGTLPTLDPVTQVRVSPEEVARLGAAVAGLADDLRWSADHTRDDAWALGPGQSRPALVEVVGDFERQRLVLGRALAELGELAQRAGGGYAVVESGVGQAIGIGGGPW